MPSGRGPTAKDIPRTRTRDELLDNVMLYCNPATGASSAHLYWETSVRSSAGGQDQVVQLPTGCSIFPKEIVPTPRSWAEKRYRNIAYWNELDRGGHFAAFEQFSPHALMVFEAARAS